MCMKETPGEEVSLYSFFFLSDLGSYLSVLEDHEVQGIKPVCKVCTISLQVSSLSPHKKKDLFIVWIWRETGLMEKWLSLDVDNWGGFQVLRRSGGKGYSFDTHWTGSLSWVIWVTQMMQYLNSDIVLVSPIALRITRAYTIWAKDPPGPGGAHGPSGPHLVVLESQSYRTEDQSYSLWARKIILGSKFALHPTNSGSNLI